MDQIHTLAPSLRKDGHTPSVELQQSIPSQVSAIAPLVDRLMRFIRKLRKMDGSEIDIELALQEALANAVIHGNHEDPHKTVCVVCRCSIDGEVSITVRDQGQGFDTSAIPDPTASGNRLSTHGRGVYLMQMLMDELQFEEGAGVIHMRKKPNAGSPVPGGSE